MATRFRAIARLSVAAFLFTCVATFAAAQDSKGTTGAQAKKVPTPKKQLKYELQPPPATFTPPTISVAQGIFDWGVVMQGEVVDHDFVIENTGGAPLRVDRVKPACGCTTTKFDRVIAPGAKGTITLSVDTKRFTGKIKKTASVFTNAGRDAYKLTMQGNIETALTFEPKIPRVDIVRGMAVAPLKVTAKKNTSKPLVFKGVEVEKDKKDLMNATLQEIDPGQSAELTLTPTIPESASKYHTVEVSVKAEVAGKVSDVPIRVSVRVRDRVEAVPPSVYFTRRDTDKLKNNISPTKTVEIRSLDPNHRFQVKEATVLGENFTVKVDTVTPGQKYNIVATLADRPARDTRRLVEKIVVKTDDALVPEITLNCTASFGVTRTTTSGGTRPSVTPRSTTTPKRTPVTPERSPITPKSQ